MAIGIFTSCSAFGKNIEEELNQLGHKTDQLDSLVNKEVVKESS